MNQETSKKLEKFYRQPSTRGQTALVAVEEVSATKGELLVPPVTEVNLALALSNYSASWRDSRGVQSKDISAGAVAICYFNKSTPLELRNPADFAVVLLRNEALEHVREETRECLGADLQAQPALEDPTLSRLMEVLLHEKRHGFRNGSLFLDGIATALASCLVRQYSMTPRAERNFTGGMAPSMLRRCIEFMDTHLERDLRLSDLAREAGLSASHFVRCFRQSTGKTPYQFLLFRRVKRAQTAMRERRASLTEVALASGFADQHHLARVFRRVTGVTPSSYRRSL
jgi:AraC family transcriptional regulator